MRVPGLRFLFIILLCVCAFREVYASSIEGKVVAVHDGDTLTILKNDNAQTKIRLAEIDAPESSQPYGSRSKQELSSLAFDKTASVQVQDIDRYGRTVGRISIE